MGKVSVTDCYSDTQKGESAKGIGKRKLAGAVSKQIRCIVLIGYGSVLLFSKQGLSGPCEIRTKPVPASADIWVPQSEAAQDYSCIAVGTTLICLIGFQMYLVHVSHLKSPPDPVTSDDL